MSLDEATTALLRQLAASGGPPLHELAPEQMRAFSAGLAGLIGAGPDMLSTRDTKAGSVPIRVLVPQDALRGLIVYYHGGGWVLGGLDEFEAIGAKLATATGSAVALVDYRLAPEAPFPAAVDDAWEAFTWLSEHAASLLCSDTSGTDLPIVVAGDSAGGNLAAVVARKAAEKGIPLAAQILVYPVTDCDFDTASYTDSANQLLLTRESMQAFFSHYVPDGVSPEHPDISPLRAPDLKGTAPAIVLTAEYDPLRDEGEAYAHRLAAQGVRVEHKRFEGQTHLFFTTTNILPASDTAVGYVATHLASILQENQS